MPTTPGWVAARNGLPGDLDATNHAAQINQMLGTHSITPIYQGAQLVTPIGGSGSPANTPNFTWLSYGTATDFDQPFTMPSGHTAIGRITIPINPVGSGADLFVGLYPDNGSGSPNTSNLLAGNTIPATWINQLAAPTGLANGGPLAAARFNTLYPTGGFTSTTWAPPAGNTNGPSGFSTPVTSGNYIISVGGSLVTGGPAAATNTVLAAKFAAAGTMDLPVPQPSLPTTVVDCAASATTSAVVVIGGYTYSPSAGALSSVYTASWDSTNGVIGSWSLQTALPQALWAMCAASSGETVYVVGGLTNSNTLVNTVYTGTVNNGQISAWTTSSYPLSVYRPAAAVIQGYLVVAGGATVYGATTDTTAVYFASIKPDGSLGAWNAGPSIPIPFDTSGTQWSFAHTDQALILVGGNSSSAAVDTFQVLTFTANGPSDTWYSAHLSGGFSLPGGSGQVGAFPLGSGAFGIVYLDYAGQLYLYTTAVPAPTLSVPLVATGLTGGATYHVVLQQGPSADSSSYLQYGINNAAMPTDAKKSVRHSGTWTTAQTGYSMPLAVYDNTVGGPILHTWQDPTSTGSTANSNIAARTSTTVYNAYNLPYGLCESTALPNDPLNSNSTFTAGTSPWTAHNCTFTQSNAQTHGGYSFSGLLTPNGTSATVNVTSELVPVTTSLESPAWYELNGWLYSPTGWSNVSLSVDWYGPSRTYITTNNTTTSLAAATWTNLANFYQAPASAAFAAINVIEGSTPAAGNTLFLSYVTITMAPEYAKTLAPVSQITYSGVWPPIGVTQLA